MHFLLHLNEFNLKDSFENYTITKIFYVTDKNTFVIFDRDVEKILNKSAKDLAKKQTKEQLMLGHT